MKKERKVRSDKKTGINPIIRMSLYDAISRLAYVCNRPLKDIGETLCIMGLRTRPVIDSLSKQFRREYMFNNSVLIMGDINRSSVREVIGPEQYRLNLRFNKATYESISALAYALDTSKTNATAQLIDTALKNKQTLYDLLTHFVREDLDDQRKKNLNHVLAYINKADRYENDLTMSALLGYLFEAIEGTTRRMTEVVGEWMDSLVAAK